MLIARQATRLAKRTYSPAALGHTRLLRSTPGQSPPDSAQSQTPQPASPLADSAPSSSDPTPRETQTGATPSADSLPPLNADAPADPAPSAAAAGGPASQVPPVNALSERQNSLAEAFLDLHPDVSPRTDDERAGGAFPGETTGAKARGAGKSSIEKKRALLARAAGLATLGGLAWAVYDLGKDWEDEDEQKKMFARSDDRQAIDEAQEGGWMGWWGRLKIRAADHLDVRFHSTWG